MLVLVISQQGFAEHQQFHCAVISVEVSKQRYSLDSEHTVKPRALDN